MLVLSGRSTAFVTSWSNCDSNRVCTFSRKRFRPVRIYPADS